MKLMRQLRWAFGILAILVMAAIWVAQSGWLRERIRAGIIEQAAKATGGKVDLGAFRFDWRTLTVEIDRLVIHGTEPAGQAPLLRIERVKARLRIDSFLRREIHIVNVEADRPQAHLVVDQSGRTNVPGSKTEGTKISSLLDLKINRFKLENGIFLAESPESPGRTIPWAASGNDLATLVTFDPAESRYSGEISLALLHLNLYGRDSVDARISAHAFMGPHRIVIEQAQLNTADSQVTFTDALIVNFVAPVITGQYRGRISLSEAARYLKLRPRLTGFLETRAESRPRPGRQDRGSHPGRRRR